MGFAEAMILEYNGRKKNIAFRLSLNKLYSRERDIFSEFVDEVEEESDDYLADERDEQLKIL